MLNPVEDYEDIKKHILKLETLIGSKKATKTIVASYQSKLDKISSKYTFTHPLSFIYAAFYELQALLHIAGDDNQAALKFLREADEIRPYGQAFTSRIAREWHKDLFAATKQSNSPEPMNSKTKKGLSERAKITIALVVGFMILIAIVAGPISDYLTIKNADPAMIKLAQEAGMTRKGELIFLRTHPQLVNDAQLTQACPSSQTNQNGFIEQGCFVPEQSDPTTGRIYIRQMTSSLHNLEITTAAYEMLHPAYISLTRQVDGGAALNNSIESNLKNLLNDDLKAQVANFEKTEPGARDLELFSILGTEYSSISADLWAFYSPYITDLNNLVALNNQVTQLFESDAAQLKSLKDAINRADANADTAYRNHVSWAYAGNQYQANYNYNIYIKDIQLENSYVDRYNSLLDEYRILVKEYNGEQFGPENKVQLNTAN